MIDRRRETDKQVVKEAIDEWLDKKFEQFGKYTARGIAAVAFAGLVYFWVTTMGFHISFEQIRGVVK